MHAHAAFDALISGGVEAAVVPLRSGAPLAPQLAAALAKLRVHAPDAELEVVERDAMRAAGGAP